jgi:hypothetical protein
MSIRDIFERQKSVVMAVAVIAILAAGYAIFSQARDLTGSGPGNAYFTIDDGQSFFTDDALKEAPFDHDGKEAWRAHVFECGGKKVVGYVERYTAHAKQLLDEVKAAAGTGHPPAHVQEMMTIGTSGTELKAPGASNKWVTADKVIEVSRIRSFACPDKSTPQETMP